MVFDNYQADRFMNSYREAQAARTRAYIRLVNLHNTEFKKLLNEERKAVGLAPVGTIRRGPKAKVNKQ